MSDYYSDLEAVRGLRQGLAELERLEGSATTTYYGHLPLWLTKDRDNAVAQVTDAIRYLVTESE